MKGVVQMAWKGPWGLFCCWQERFDPLLGGMSAECCHSPLRRAYSEVKPSCDIFSAMHLSESSHALFVSAGGSRQGVCSIHQP